MQINKQEAETIKGSTDLDCSLNSLTEEVGYATDLFQSLFYLANKLKTIQEEIEPISNNIKSIQISTQPFCFLESLDYQIEMQRKNNKKLNKIITHLNKVI